MAHLPCISWVQVGGALTLCACSTPFEFVSFWPSHHFCCLLVCLILLYILVCIYLLWREGCVGFWAYVPCLSSLLWTRHCMGKGSHFPAEPMFFFLVSVGLLAIYPATSLHCACYNFTLPLLCVTPWTCGLTILSCQPTSVSIFCSGLPRPTFHIFTFFGFCLPTFLLC